MQNLPDENEIDLSENDSVGGTHYRTNGFTLGLVLTQRHKATRNGSLNPAISNSHGSETKNRPIEREFEIRSQAAIVSL